MPTTPRSSAPSGDTMRTTLRCTAMFGSPSGRGQYPRLEGRELPSSGSVVVVVEGYEEGDRMDRSERSWSVVRAFDQLNGDLDGVALTDQRDVDCVTCLAIADRSNDSG